MLQRLTQWLRNGSRQPIITTAPQPLPVAANDEASNDNGTNEFSISKTANEVLHATLFNQTVTRHGHPRPVAFPVKRVTLKGTGNMGGYVPESEQSIPHGEELNLEVVLSRPYEDYDPSSLSAAIQNTLAAIPSFAGKIKAKPLHDHPPTYADVWAELKPLLAQKPDAFPETDMALIEQYFTASQGKPDRSDGKWDQAISARHFNDKVTIDINSHELPQDGPAAASGDAGLAEYFKKHHDHILGEMKKKVLELGVLKPGDLDQLQMYAVTRGRGLAIEFGTKPTVTKDAQTGAELTEIQLAEKMTETPLTKIDTQELGKIFTGILLDSSKELPPILPRIADGPMLANLIRTRTGDDAAINAVLSSHELFKSEDDLKNEKTEAVKNHMITLNEPHPGETRDGQPMVNVSFNLPPGVQLKNVLEEIAATQSQMRVGAQPRTGFAQAVGA